MSSNLAGKHVTRCFIPVVIHLPHSISRHYSIYVIVITKYCSTVCEDKRKSSPCGANYIPLRTTCSWNGFSCIVKISLLIYKVTSPHFSFRQSLTIRYIYVTFFIDANTLVMCCWQNLMQQPLTFCKQKFDLRGHRVDFKNIYTPMYMNFPAFAKVTLTNSVYDRNLI